MTKQVGEFVENFVSSPAGRTKDIIPNLFTLIGYIVAMPTEQSRKIFCLEGKHWMGENGNQLGTKICYFATVFTVQSQWMNI